MVTGFLHLHLTSVILFLFIYVFRLVGLFIPTGPIAKLANSRFFRIAPMVLSFIFLATGIFLFIKTPVETIGNFFWFKLAAVLLSIPIAVVGFKKGNKALATFSVLLIVIAYGMAEMNKKNPKVSADTASKTEGKEIFISANCVLCHGENGKLMASGSKDLTLSVKTQEEIQQLISKGKGNMPAFSKQLTEAQIKAVASYVMDFRKK